MITIKLKYEFDDLNDQKLLIDYLNQYNNCYHYVINRLQENKKVSYKELKNLNNIDVLDSWFIMSCLNEAKNFYNKNKNKKIIFGGRKNFINRCKLKISREEFLSKRLIPLCSLGTKASKTTRVHGNRKFKLNENLSFILIKLNNKKIKLNLNFKLKSNLKNKLLYIYKHQVLDDTPITYKINLNYIYIIFNEKEIYPTYKSKSIKNRILALDQNPNYIGWSIVDWTSSSKFKLIKYGIFSFKSLNDKEILNQQNLSNKRKYELFEISKKLINTALYYKCEIIGIEKLNIKSKNTEKGKLFNRLVNNLWIRDAFTKNLHKRCNIFNLKFLEIEASYSSFIGNFLFRSLNKPDMVLSSIEIGRRAYEFYNQYILKTKEKQKNIIQPKIEDFKNLYKKSLEEFNIQDKSLDFIGLYYIFKKSKLTYRLSLDKFKYLKFSRFYSLKNIIYFTIN